MGICTIYIYTHMVFTIYGIGVLRVLLGLEGHIILVRLI